MEEETEINADEKGPIIMECDVVQAIKDMRRKKATRDDNIPVEILKLFEGNGLKQITILMNKIYSTGMWPKDFLEVTMVPLMKKNNASDFRTISLTSQVSKLLKRILAKRLEKKAEAVLKEAQFGFRKGRGTRDALSEMLKIISERAIELNQDINNTFHKEFCFLILCRSLLNKHFYL